MQFPRTRRPTIVVGYDGSPASRAAVDYAVDRLEDGGHLVLVHAFEAPPEHVGTPFYEELVARAADHARSLLQGLERDCPALARVDHEPDVLAGRPGDVLCRVARQRGASALVLGSRGVGRMRAVLGSVAHDVLHRADCPVVVIPERMLEERSSEVATAARS